MEEMAEQYDQVLAMLNSLKQARLEKMNEILAKVFVLGLSNNAKMSRIRNNCGIL